MVTESQEPWVTAHQMWKSIKRSQRHVSTETETVTCENMIYNLMSKHGCQTSLALQWTESHSIRDSFIFKFKCTKSEDFRTTSLLFKEMANSYQNSHFKNWNFRLCLMKIIVSLLFTASLCQNPLTSSCQQNNLTNSDLSQGFLLLKIIYQPWKVKHLQHKHDL